MQIKNYFLLILVLLTVGCAGPQLTVVSQAGGPMPDPHYIARSTSGIQIRATYYYVGLNEIKDADESTHYTPTYLDRKTSTIKSGDYKKLQLMLEVYNPFNVTYLVKTQQIVQRDINDQDEITQGMVAVSKLNYRHYMFQLPLEGKRVMYNVSLVSEDGREIFMQTGTFEYQLK